MIYREKVSKALFAKFFNLNSFEVRNYRRLFVLMVLSKENVLEFCVDTGIRVGQRKYQTLQNIPNVREIAPTECVSTGEKLLFVCKTAKIPEGRE
jgi:hypothetical protein